MLREPMGIKILIAGATSVIFGALVMKKMVNIKV